MFYLLTCIKIQSSFKNKNRIAVSKESQERDPWQKLKHWIKIKYQILFPLLENTTNNPSSFNNCSFVLSTTSFYWLNTYSGLWIKIIKQIRLCSDHNFINRHESVLCFVSKSSTLCDGKQNTLRKGVGWKIYGLMFICYFLFLLQVHNKWIGNPWKLSNKNINFYLFMKEILIIFTPCQMLQQTKKE